MLGIAIFMMYKHAKMVANMKHKETSRAESIKWVWLFYGGDFSYRWTSEKESLQLHL